MTSNCIPFEPFSSPALFGRPYQSSDTTTGRYRSQSEYEAYLRLLSKVLLELEDLTTLQEDVIKPLHEVTKIALLHDCTLICAWRYAVSIIYGPLLACIQIQGCSSSEVEWCIRASSKHARLKDASQLVQWRGKVVVTMGILSLRRKKLLP